MRADLTTGERTHRLTLAVAVHCARCAEHLGDIMAGTSVRDMALRADALATEHEPACPGRH